MNEKYGKLLYHLTDFNNLESIIKNGLCSREEIRLSNLKFSDVADPEIIDFRNDVGLNDYVPFHFFVKNPFDGKVQNLYKDTNFVYICITRKFAEKNNLKIIPQHPKSMTDLVGYDYKEGFEIIDWETLEERDYTNQYCKNVCMAECVSYNKIDSSDFFSIVTKDNESLIAISKLYKKYNRQVTRLNCNPSWFL